MPAIAALTAAAAAWCFLQAESRQVEALGGGAGPNGNFLDNDQWLSTVSQYDPDKYWNRFRDVSTASLALREGGLSEGGSGGRGRGLVQTSQGSLWVPGSWAASCLRRT